MIKPMSWKQIFIPIAILTITASSAVGQAVAPSAEKIRCEALTALKIPSVEFTNAKEIPAGPLAPPSGEIAGQFSPALPSHCLVQGWIDKRIGVGGRPYAIGFELRLPDQWNGRFLFQGGGGLNGTVRPAIGSVKGPAALPQGFAVVTTDAGHQTQNGNFGEDQQARIDMAYRSYDRVTVLAKQLIETYYGKPADKSYFFGCSEGGREAMLMSQRFPLYFDGIVAGDPGFELGRSAPVSGWRHDVIAQIAPKSPDGALLIGKAFSAEDLNLVAKIVLETCDQKDGLKDGLIDDVLSCKTGLAVLTCKGAKTDACLTVAQVAALEKVIGGVKDSEGVALTRGLALDTGIGTPGWRQWIMPGKPVVVRDPGVGPLGYFVTPFDPKIEERNLDLDETVEKTAETAAINDAVGTQLSTFQQHGGKLLVYTGVSDPIFSPYDLVDYYTQLMANNGGLAAAQSFARLFLVPGMTHCRGGQSLDEFDPLAAVVNWVEKGITPDYMPATGSTFPGRTRPLCAYPKQTRYKGSGSIDDAPNFECR